MEDQVSKCNDCQRVGHIARFCPDQKGGKCGLTAHHERDCPRRGQLNRLRLWMPMDIAVRMAVSSHPLREVPGIGPNLQLLRSATPVSLNGSTFSGENNTLTVQYGGEDSIVIAMQDADTEEETLIQVRPNYVQGIKVTRVRVGAKFMIENRVLQEAIERLATGNRKQKSPKADTHVLLYIQDMLNSTVALDVNGEKYFLEWLQRDRNGNVQADVSVFSRHTYNHRLANETRDLVHDPRYYFQGIANEPLIRAAVLPPREPVQNQMQSVNESPPSVAENQNTERENESSDQPTGLAVPTGDIAANDTATNIRVRELSTMELTDPEIAQLLEREFEEEYDDQIANWYAGPEPISVDNSGDEMGDHLQ